MTPFRRTMAAFMAVLVTAAMPARAQNTEVNPDDVASPEAIVQAAYDAIQRPPGENYDWDRMRTLMLPGAMLIPQTEQLGGAFKVLSPDEFAAWIDRNTVVGGPDDRGFAEETVHNVVHEFGDIATVFSTYQKRFWDDDQILGRGINAFQLVRHEGRWWIVSIIWDEDNSAGPIPAQYLPAGH